MSAYFQAKLKGYRVSARKARLVADVVRGRKVSDAIDALRLMNKKSAPVFKKLIESAMANAQDRATVDIDRLHVSECLVDEGVTMKRWLPRAQGRATPIRKRSSHITVRLTEK